jgi:sialidase-1
MEIVLDMGIAGGLPEGQNGIGDPAVLVDENTGEIIVAAAWTHGMGGRTGWWAAGDGFDPIDTPQLMMARSGDGGLVFTEPVNVTAQVKKPEWKFSFQGPGRGITMKDGTLVFAYQHQEGEDRMPWSGIIYSKDHGQTWHVSESPVANTTEAQVAEVQPGVIMLNMRNNEKTGRRVFTTSDLGKTWKVHPSDKTLREPVCMASLICGPRAGQLLFSNPDSDKSRDHMTIKMSTDGGLSWPYALLLDEFGSWGYSCMSMIDDETVGILYEGSTSQIVFQAVKLSDIMAR